MLKIKFEKVPKKIFHCALIFHEVLVKRDEDCLKLAKKAIASLNDDEIEEAIKIAINNESSTVRKAYTAIMLGMKLNGVILKPIHNIVSGYLKECDEMERPLLNGCIEYIEGLERLLSKGYHITHTGWW
jgi:hypothetical protein